MAVVLDPLSLVAGRGFWRVQIIVLFLVIWGEVCAPLLRVWGERVLGVARVRCCAGVRLGEQYGGRTWSPNESGRLGPRYGESEAADNDGLLVKEVKR